MIITTVLYTGLEVILSLAEWAITWIATRILDESITVFKADQNIFQTFIDLLPFSSSIALGSIIKGISFGLVILLLLISVVKSISSPFTGDDAPNPAQSVIRAAVAVVMIIGIFGVGVGGNGATVQFTGLLSVIGKWFGTILSLLGKLPTHNVLNIKITADPRIFLAALILEITVLISIISAALQYVERIVSFALYIILGPVAVSMYASKETESIAKDWFVGVLTQFLAIFVSLIMWIAFIESTNVDFEKVGLIHYAVLISILGLMRNSEKVLNAIGFQTMRLGDTARAFATGAGVFMAATSTAMNQYNHRFAAAGARPAGAGSSARGFVSPFNSKGEFGNTASMLWQQDKQVFASGMTPFVPSISSIRNASSQNKAMASLKTAVSKGDSIDAKTFNTAMGLSSQTSVRAVGNGERSMLQPATVSAADGKEIRGFVGDAAINRGGQVEIARNTFFPTSDLSSIDVGTTVNMGSDYQGPQMYILGGGPSIDNQNHYAYITTLENPNVQFSELKNETDDDLIKPNSVEKTIDHEPRNI